MLNDELFELLPDFESLLTTKSFDQLDTNEKELILRALTPAEYDSMRAYLLKSIELFANEERTEYAGKEIKEKLMHSFKATAPSVWLRIVNNCRRAFDFRLPVWQTALFLLAAILLVGKLNRPQESIRSDQFRVDTVYVEKQNAAQDTEKQAIKRGTNALMIPGNKAASRTIKNKSAGLRDSSVLVPGHITQPFSVAVANVLTYAKGEKRGKSIDRDSNLYRGLVIMQ